MPLIEGEYEPSTMGWVRNQVETYERTGGREANTLLNTGLPIIIVTTRGNKSGKVRKTPLMRVEHEGEYALVASMGGAPKHPVWYWNLKADPDRGDDPGRPRAVPRRSARAGWRREGSLVGTSGGGVSAVRRISATRRAHHPRLRRAPPRARRFHRAPGL